MSGSVLDKLMLDDMKKSDKVVFATFPEGNTQISLLEIEAQPKWAHWIASQKKSIICNGKGCPICEIISAAKANKETPRYSSSKKYAMWVFNHTTGNVELLDCTKSLKDEIVDSLREYNEENPDNKLSLSTASFQIRRKGTLTDTTYKAKTIKKLAVPEDALQKALDYGDILQYFVGMTNEQMVELIGGKLVEDILGWTKKDDTTSTVDGLTLA